MQMRGQTAIPDPIGGREFSFRASFAQQRLWFLDQYNPGTSLYNVSRAWRIIGSMNPVVLEKSLNEIMRRHESLRTTFSLDGDTPVQIVRESSCLKLDFRNLVNETDSE